VAEQETSAGPEEQKEPLTTQGLVAVEMPKPTGWQRVKTWWHRRQPIDPWAWRRRAIKEEDGVHKAWYAEARKVRTIWQFVRFHDRLMNAYSHDYGTVVHAVAAISLAGACLANSNRYQGGITGFQAGAVMWQWLEGWGTGPRRHGRMLDYDNMLYPQYEHQFRTITPAVWTALQKEAERLLADAPRANEQVRAHWRSIIEGKVPFGYTVKEN